MSITYEAVPRPTTCPDRAGDLSDPEAVTRTSSSLPLNANLDRSQLEHVAPTVSDTTAAHTTGSLSLVRCCTDEERELAKKLRPYTFVIHDWREANPATECCDIENSEIQHAMGAAKEQQGDCADEESMDETRDGKGWSISRYVRRVLAFVMGSCTSRYEAPSSSSSSVSWSRDSSLFDVPAIPCSVVAKKPRRAPMPEMLRFKNIATSKIPSSTEPRADEQVLVQREAIPSYEGSRYAGKMASTLASEDEDTIINPSASASSPKVDMVAVSDVWPERL